ncbi:MAG: HEPN domain-containing protein [bacterium]|nr:HEPN domain-containing protein [bacterium]
MNETLLRWLSKADGDYNTAKRELAVIENPNYDSVFFHSQQCVEKLFKALLIHNSQTPPKIHDLLELYRIMIEFYPDIRINEHRLTRLSLGAVNYRYPYEEANEDDATEAFETCRSIREIILPLFNS